MRNIKLKMLSAVMGVVIGGLLLSGCAQMRDKFVRTRKDDSSELPRYQQVRSYTVRPTLELYTQRYVYWNSWHNELLAVLDDTNHKKKTMAAQQALSNMISMSRMLEDDLREELLSHVDEMRDIERQIARARLTSATEMRIRRRLETMGRQIRRDFSYTAVPDSIRSEFATR